MNATTEGFVDSGIVLTENMEITLSASGLATFAQSDPALTRGPDGFPGECLGGCPLDGVNIGALIVKIGDANPAVAGAGPITLTGSGPVSFAFNDTAGTSGDNGGSFLVTAQYDNGLTAPTLAGLPFAGVLGDPYQYTFAVAGNPEPVVTATGELPDGVTLSETGVLSGIPTAIGSFTFTVTATNSVGTSAPLAVTVEVPAIAPPSTGSFGSADLFFGFGS